MVQKPDNVSRMDNSELASVDMEAKVLRGTYVSMQWMGTRAREGKAQT
jgi:hypothetical protein